jgi:thiol-disulfide isomerase/thioredoxin
MEPLAPGSTAPSVPSFDSGAGPKVIFFYKVTCPACQMSAPKVQAFEEAYPGAILGVGQDPKDKLLQFSKTYGMTFRSIPDTEPYEISNQWGIRVVPTTFLVDGDTIVDAVEAWNRDGLNGISKRVAATGGSYRPISDAGDGLPAFRPGCGARNAR